MNRRIFISGASSGIGFELARHYLESGATVGLLARRPDKLSFFAENWPESARIYSADVRDLPAIQSAARDFISHCGCPDIVIANAGISIGNLTEFSEDIDSVQDIFDTNVIGMIKTFQPYIHGMKAAKSGKLVGIASVAGFRGLPGAGAYSSSKAAAINYLESLRSELYGSGVDVVTICPGYVDTPMTAHNPYPMPFLVPADRAAKKIANAISSGKLFYTFPWQMMIVGKIMVMLPKRLHAFVFSKAPHKPRRESF